MTVVFDSSVWISALQFGGVPLEALDLTVDRFRIALCEPILEEVYSALLEKFNWNKAAIAEALAEYGPETMMAATTGALRGACRDVNDDVIIECTVNAGAELIVTGDKDRLALGSYEGIRVVTPRAFLDEFARSAKS